MCCGEYQKQEEIIQRCILLKNEKRSRKWCTFIICICMMVMGDWYMIYMNICF